MGSLSKNAKHRLTQAIRYFAPELKLNQQVNFRYLLEKASIQKSVDYVFTHMPDAQALESRYDLYEHVLKRMRPGAIVELGVGRGTSINYIAKRVQNSIHGFDSFVGFPDDGLLPKPPKGLKAKWSGAKFYAGKYDLAGSLPAVEKNVVLHKGWFSDTLPRFAEQLQESISLLHVDCDIYSATKQGFEILGDKIVPGTIIVFDELFGFLGWHQHEVKAFNEFVAQRKVEFEYIAYTFDGQVAVLVKSIGH